MTRYSPDLTVVDRVTYGEYVRAHEVATAVNENSFLAQMLSFDAHGVRIAAATYFQGGGIEYKIVTNKP